MKFVEIKKKRKIFARAKNRANKKKVHKIGMASRRVVASRRRSLVRRGPASSESYCARKQGGISHAAGLVKCGTSPIKSVYLVRVVCDVRFYFHELYKFFLHLYNLIFPGTESEQLGNPLDSDSFPRGIFSCGNYLSVFFVFFYFSPIFFFFYFLKKNFFSGSHRFI